MALRRWSLTLLSDYLPQGTLVLDTSVVFNLLGSGEPIDFLRGLGHPCLIEEKTLKEVKRHPIPGRDLAAALNTLFIEEILQEARMTEVEYDTFIGIVHAPLGVRLDDGESAAIAISARGAGIVLDEKRARRRVSEGMPDVVVVSSLKLMLTSAHRQSWSLGRLKEAVEMARLHARMGVPKDEADLLRELLAPA